jgi:hypothetical protein
MNYKIKGVAPSLLIITGLHGDEFEIVPLVEKIVEQYYEKLPDFVYIPAASSSALKLKTRTNETGVDLNRSFYHGTTVLEAQSLMSLLSGFHFKLVLEIHEDPLVPDPEKFDGDFYLYDIGTDTNFVHSSAWARLINDITSLGIKMYNGIDDPSDSTLGHLVKDGYVHATADPSGGGIDDWMICNGLAERVFIPEVPGKISLETKSKIIDFIFRRLILKEEN